MLTATVMIPTYHRLDELTVALESILEQIRLPEELIVVDDGNLPDLPLRSRLEAAGIYCRFERKEKPGLTESRNLAVSLAQGDVVLFFDDDVRLFPGYIESVMALYEADTEREIGGVGGLIVNHKPLGFGRRLRRLWDVLFLNSGVTEGKALPSGFCTNYGATMRPPEEVVEVDFLAGAACSYRFEVFDELRFTDRYRDFGFGEDKDFSYQVARRWSLLVDPHARIYHYESPAMRPNRFLSGRKFIIGRYLFLRDHVLRGWWNWALFGYAVTGYLLARLMILLMRPGREEWDRVRGILAALGDIVRGRVRLA